MEYIFSHFIFFDGFEFDKRATELYGIWIAQHSTAQRTHTQNYFTSIRFLLGVKWKGMDSIFNHRLIRLLVTFAKKVFHEIRLGPRLVVPFKVKNKEEACSRMHTHITERIYSWLIQIAAEKSETNMCVFVYGGIVAVLKQWIELGTFDFRCRYAMLTKTVNKRIKSHKRADNKNRRTKHCTGEKW